MIELVPKELIFTKGVGKHKEQLTSFELALHTADIAACNLVRVSSIFPPGCKILTRTAGIAKLKPGQVTLVVMSEAATREPHRLLTATIARWRHLAWRVPRLAVMLLLAASAPVHAQVFESLGVRALGMGGAFVAVADDATATYWNPAGLTNVASSAVLEVQRIETRVELDSTLRAETSNRTTFASLATPTVGLSYYRLRSRQVDRVTEGGDTPASLTSIVTHHAGITVVQPLGPGVAIATVLKAVRGTVAVGTGDGGAPVGALFDQASELSSRSTTRLDLDAGVMIGAGAISVAVVGRNLREPEFAVSDDAAFSLRRQLRAGLSVRPTGSLVVALDVDLSIMATAVGPRRNIALGVEQRLGRLVVRGGGRVNLEDDDRRPLAAFGLSVEAISGFWLDGQVTGGRDGGDRGWGVSMRVGP